MTTVVPNDIEKNQLQAIFLKAHLKLMAAGFRHSKVSPREMLDKAGAITGKKYKRGQFELALVDVTHWLEDNK